MAPLGKGATTCRLRGSYERKLFLFRGVQLSYAIGWEICSVEKASQN